MEIFTSKLSTEVKIKLSTATWATFAFHTTRKERYFWKKDAARQSLKAKTKGMWELCPVLELPTLP